MELALIAILVTAALAGVVLRRSVDYRVARRLLIMGAVSLAVGVVTLFGPLWNVSLLSGMGRVIASLVAWIVAAMVIPFAMVVMGVNWRSRRGTA